MTEMCAMKPRGPRLAGAREGGVQMPIPKTNAHRSERSGEREAKEGEEVREHVLPEPEEDRPEVARVSEYSPVPAVPGADLELPRRMQPEVWSARGRARE